MSETQYLIVIEGPQGSNFSAYSPDIPGVVATGETREKCEREMQKAIQFHIEGLRLEGESIPASTSTGAYIKVSA